MRLLITGGCGFVGSRLALRFREQFPSGEVVAFDNLRRRGSERNIALLQRAGVTFVHGDIRTRSDLFDLGNTPFDLMIEASAEASVHAGRNGSPDYVLDTNLSGTLNCLEYARRFAVGAVVFLSTSRVYSIEPMRQVALREEATRFEIAEKQTQTGVSPAGFAEDFTTTEVRSLYGATKLASELIIQEYVAAYGLKAVINRCGVIAGAGQFGKTDQGVFTLWAANHFYNRPLRYTGFGGTGKQVRDLLHPDDLQQLIVRQMEKIETCAGMVYNVGGGRAISVSLLEMTALCEEATGNTVSMAVDPATSPVDIPLYLSDYGKAARAFDWKPQRSAKNIVEEIVAWLKENHESLRPLFAPDTTVA